MSEKIACVILAAGKGTRMKSSRPKVMHELAGRPMIGWLLATVGLLDPEKTIVVTGPDMPELEEAVRPHETVIQKKRLGTGDAVMAALPALEGFDGRVLILMGDEPLVPFQVLEQMAAADAPLVVQGLYMEDPAGLGRLIQDGDGSLLKIVEEKDCTDEELVVPFCNAGNYAVDAASLKKWLPQVGNDNAQGEYYLTDIVGIAVNDGARPQVMESFSEHVWGVNSRLQLAEHEAIVQMRLRYQALENGTTLQDPGSVCFCWDTKVGQDVTIGANVVFGPGVEIEDNVTILPFCHLEGAKIKSGAVVGPFARLRPGTLLEEDAKIGNFVEVKNTRVGKGSKASHLTYLGDAEIGEGCNIGAGTIFCNYDGAKKHKTELGDSVFIGSNSTLIAPITIGDGAYVAAGSAITQNVSPDALAVARNRPIIRDGWAKARREKAKKVG